MILLCSLLILNLDQKHQNQGLNKTGSEEEVQPTKSTQDGDDVRFGKILIQGCQRPF